MGRPTKELYANIGALILQQTFDLADEETVREYACDIQWHYALNITEESDSAKYLSLYYTLYRNAFAVYNAVVFLPSEYHSVAWLMLFHFFVDL